METGCIITHMEGSDGYNDLHALSVFRYSRFLFFYFLCPDWLLLLALLGLVDSLLYGGLYSLCVHFVVGLGNMSLHLQ